MARRNAIEMVNEVAANIGDSEHLKVSQGTILRLLNDAAVEIAILHEPTECVHAIGFDTIAEQRDYNAGEDFTIPAERQLLKILSLVNMTAGMRMLEVDDTWARVVNPNNSTSGTPTHWYNLDSVGYIRLYPTPDREFSIAMAYLHKPFDLVLEPAPNFSRLNLAWDEVQVALATSRAFRRLQNWQASEQWKKDAMMLAGQVRAAITPLNAEPWPVGNLSVWSRF